MMLDTLCFVCEKGCKIWEAAHRQYIEEQHGWRAYSISICFICLGFTMEYLMCANPGLEYSILAHWKGRVVSEKTL